MDEYNLTEKIGHYSGNRRLDTYNCEEPRYDDDKSRSKWLGGDRKIRMKRKIRRWRNKILKTIRPKNLSVHIVGQSHIDCAWMWRYEQTIKKAQVTYNKAIIHSNLFPETFRFALSQPLILEWIKADNPQLFAQIQEKVENSNIELVGGSYVEPDCMMPSGEAMIRQRLYGMRFYYNNFKRLPEVEWFLDSFGYNFGLPQILSKSGAKYLWTSKMTWNRDTTFPFVNFWWKGADGSELLAANFHYDPQVLETWEEYEIGRHFLKNNAKKIWDYSSDYSLLKNHIEPDKICPHVGFFFGQSDGGHGPTHKEVAEANKLVNLDWFNWSSVEDFFREVEKDSDYFPIWNDELYLEFHRGCFSNHGQVKHFNRKYENLLPSVEKLALLTSLIFSYYSYPQEVFEKLWKITLKNQFHDVLPGSSIPEVYDDCWDDWREQDNLIKEVLSNIGNNYSIDIKGNSENSKQLLLFNSLSWARTSPLFIPINTFDKNIELDKNQKPPFTKLTLLNQSGKEYLCQPVAAEGKDLIDPKPAGWWTVLEIEGSHIVPAKIELIDEIEIDKLKKDKINRLRITSTSLGNYYIDLELDPRTGAIHNLKSTNINHNKNLLTGNKSNLTLGFLDDVPIQYHAWNLTPEYWNHPIELSNKKNVEINLIDEGPIFSSLEISKLLGESPVTQKITLFNDLPLIYFDYITDWKRENTMLKINYSPNLNAEKVTADGMNCAISSTVHPLTPCDKARFEKICHKYFDLSTPDNSWGMALINEDKYAYDVLEGNMRLTILRACRYPEVAPEAWVNKERELNEQYHSHKIPEYSGLGSYSCHYALFPHTGGALQNHDGTPNVIVKRKAEEFNNPIISIPVDKAINLDIFAFNEAPFLKISPDNVVIQVLKTNEWSDDNSIILRVHEVCGIPSKVNIEFGDFFKNKITSIASIDLLERDIDGEFLWNEVDYFLNFDIGKFEILTFKLRWKF